MHSGFLPFKRLASFAREQALVEVLGVVRVKGLSCADDQTGQGFWAPDPFMSTNQTGCSQQAKAHAHMLVNTRSRKQGGRAWLRVRLPPCAAVLYYGRWTSRQLWC